VPHRHDVADSVDVALEASRQGVRAIKISLGVLGVTACRHRPQLLRRPDGGAVWVAFVIGRRPPSRRYTYGFGQIEDLAGLFIVAMTAVSAVVAAVESIPTVLRAATGSRSGCGPRTT
jgi:hypothetical protein